MKTLIKRAFTILMLITISLLSLGLRVNVQAETNNVVSLENTSGLYIAPNSEFTTTVTLNNAYRISGFQLSLLYDYSKFDLVSVEKSSDITSNIEVNLSESGVIKIVYSDISNLLNGRVDLFDITFLAKSNLLMTQHDLLVEDDSFSQMLTWVDDNNIDIYGITDIDFNFSPVNVGIMGDVNLDGSVDIIDVGYIQQYIVEKRTFDANQIVLGDVNNDGDVDIIDVAYIQQYLVGTRSTLGEVPIGVETVYANGIYNYKYANSDLRHTFMAAAEDYLLHNLYGGIPLFDNGYYMMYSSRILLPVSEYIPVLEYGVKLGTMTADDSTVILDDNNYGEIGHYTYRTTIPGDPYNWNQWQSVSYDQELMDYYYGKLYDYDLNNEGTGYELNPSMAAATPTPIEGRMTDAGSEVAYTWQITLRDDLMWYFHPDTDTSFISGLTTDDYVIDANDFVETYKLVLDNVELYNSYNEFIESSQAIAGANEYFEGLNSWEEVGIKVINPTTFEFTFVEEQSNFCVREWLESFVLTPINMELYDYLENDGDDLTTYGTNNTTIGYHGPFYCDNYVEGEKLVLNSNPNYHNPDEYFYDSYLLYIETDSEVIWQMFEAGLLDEARIPTTKYEDYKDSLDILYVPGSTVFRIMVNGFGTVEAQTDLFPDSIYIPEPILANQNFKSAMFFAIDREYLTSISYSTRGPSTYLFTSAYLVDAELGIAYRDTDQGQTVGTDLATDTYGFNFDAAQAYYNLALEELITAGDVIPGTVVNPTIITIEFNYFSGSDIQLAMANYIEEAFESAFQSTEYYINIDIVTYPKDFPSIYYDYMMIGSFDLSIGGISGSLMDAANLLEIYCSDNRSGFTLNWGIDTSVAEIEVNYYDDFGVPRSEIWSFDAITSALNGEVELINGEEYKEIVDLDAIINLLESEYADTLGNESFRATEDLNLISTLNEVQVTWFSNNTDFVENDGTIHRPSYIMGDQTVILTALLEKDGESAECYFFVTVKALDKTDLDRANEAFVVVTAFPYKESWVASDSDTLSFLTTGTDNDGINYSVTWSTSHPELISIDGNIIQPNGEDVVVTMTATITINGIDYIKIVEFTVAGLEEGIPVSTIAEALALGEDAYVEIMGATVYAINNRGNIYITDGTDFLYIYNPPFEVIEGETYNFSGMVYYYYDTPQLSGNDQLPLLAEFSDAVPVTPIPTQATSIEEIISTSIIPSNENPYNYVLYEVTCRVYYNEEWGSYSVFLVPTNYDFAAEVTGAIPNGDAIMVYYQSDYEDLMAYHGQEVTIQILIAGWRTDKLVWYGNYFNIEE